MSLFKRKAPKAMAPEAQNENATGSVMLDLSVLKKNNITRLTIDERWTRLFATISMNPELETAQAEVNELIKKEAMLRQEQENLEPTKRKCMNQIISLTKEAFENNNSEAKNKLKECKKEIERINARVDKILEDIEKVTDSLKESNMNLLIQSIHYIFTTLKQSKLRAQEIRQELAQIEARQQALNQELESINVDWTSLAVDITELIGSDNVRNLEKEFGLEELMHETSDSGSDESH
jgi:predicted RNase H-like nuclease (RuvC/YqgF family)